MAGFQGLLHLHLFVIALSVLLLIARYGLQMANSDKVNHRFFKAMPHAVDTCIILTGIGLIMVSGVMPFTEAGRWLTEKLSCVLAYFALGYFALHMCNNKVLKTFAFLGALGWLVMAAQLAMTKVPFLG